MTDDRRGHIVLVLGLLAAISFVALAVWCRFPVPYRDDWDWLVWTLSGPISLDRLFQPHNEHLIPLARLLYWAQYQLEGAKGQLLFWGTLLAHLTLVLVIARECRVRWPDEGDWRRVATGLTLILLCFAWQLQSIVFIAAFLFPAVQTLATVAVMAQVTGHEAGRRQWPWMAAAHLASLAAILTTTNGLAVPVTLAMLAWAQRGSRLEIASHIAMAAAGGAAFYAIVLAPGASASVHIGGPGAMLAYFAAFFAPFVTYISVSAGVIVGALAALPGLWFISRVVFFRRPAPRLEWLAAGLMLFAFGSATLAAVGRGSFGVHQAAQSRYATYALVYWVALILAGMSMASRSGLPRRWWSEAIRLATVPAAVVVLAAHAVSGAVWLTKSANVSAAGLALRAGVPDEAWIRTLHPLTTVVFTAERLLSEAGDPSLMDPAIGEHREIAAATPACAGVVSVTRVDNPSGPTLRLNGWINVTARRALVLDAVGAVIGLATPAPLVAIPEPSREQVVAAVLETLTRDAESGTRWFGLATAGTGGPYRLVPQTRDEQTMCVLALTPADTNLSAR